jgi:dipeptidyl aminopeptidase/acylaminoacyl peptidase
VGGWSYGGILTDYIIATDTRFKGATSGAGTAFTVAFYGTDQYIIQYDYEIGPPWNPKPGRLIKDLVSIPARRSHQDADAFLRRRARFQRARAGRPADVSGAAKSGRRNQLVIYPNEFHGITRPSYVKDRYERYLAWYDKYVKKAIPTKNVTDTGQYRER